MNWVLCIDTLIIKQALKKKLDDFIVTKMSFTMKLLILSY